MFDIKVLEYPLTTTRNETTSVSALNKIYQMNGRILGATCWYRKMDTIAGIRMTEFSI
jgi:hypothetical protein